MRESLSTIVRAFDGSLADARGLLAVEQATFAESPYSAEEVCGMLSCGPRGQQAWLALEGGQVVGFLVAFATHGLQGSSWEMDLLAVHPDAAGRGLATRLIRAGAAHGARLADRARAVVAAENDASARAFLRAGFVAGRQRCQLLIHRAAEHGPLPSPGPGTEVRPVESPSDMGPWQHLAPAAASPSRAGLSLLVARESGEPAGYVELLEVQTLLYRGFWIESLVALSHRARIALVQAVVAQAAAAGLDEVGAMVPGSDPAWLRAFLELGFHSLGDFAWYAARLPLPGLAAAPFTARREAVAGGSHE